MKIGFKETTYEEWAIIYYYDAQEEAIKREKEFGPCLFCAKEQQMYKMIWIFHLNGGFWWFCNEICLNCHILRINSQ
jgi:hypothetical protein